MLPDKNNALFKEDNSYNSRIIHIILRQAIKSDYLDNQT